MRLLRAPAFFEVIANLGSDFWFDARVEPDGAIVMEFVSEGFERLLGYSLEDLRGPDAWGRTLHPDDVPRVRAQLPRLLAGEDVEGVVRHRTRDGRVLWAEYRTRPVRDKSGRVVRLYGATRSIDAQRRAEEALRESENQYRTLVSQVKDYAIFALDTRGRPVSWNEGVRNVLGYERDEFLALAADAIFTPEDRAAGVPEQELAKATREGTAGNDRWLQAKGGRRFFAAGITTALRDASGSLIGFSKVMRDQTQWRLATDALAAGEQRLRISTEAANLGVFEWDAQADRAMWENSRMYEIFGRRPEDGPVGKAEFFASIITPEDLPAVHQALESALTPGGQLRVSCRIRRPDGALRWIEISAQHSLSAAGAARLVGVVADVTDRKEAEQKLLRSEERYRAFIANSAEGIWRLEFDPPIDTAAPLDEQVEHAFGGRIAECNDVMARMYGLARAEDLVGRRLEFMLPRADPAAREYVASVIRSGYRASDVESVERDAHGDTVYFLNSMAGVVEHGRLIRMWGTQRDISSRKAAESALASAMEDLALQVRALTRLHGLAARLSGPVKPGSALQAVLETLVELHGADSGVLLTFSDDSRTLSHAASVGLGEESLRILARVLPGPAAGPSGAAFARGERVVVEDSEQDPLFAPYREAARAAGVRAAHSTPIASREGHRLGVITVFFGRPRRPSEREVQVADLCAREAADAIEVSRHREAERRINEALRDSEARFREMADHAPVMVWVSEPDGACSYLSRSWYDFTGQTPETGLGFGWIHTVHPDDQPLVRRAFAEAHVARNGFRLEYRLRNASGEYRWAIWAASPRLTADGRFLGFVGSVLDITDRKHAEEQLVNQQARLEEAVRARTHELKESHERLRIAERLAALGTLSAGLGHDLGNLLMPLRVRVDSLAQAGLPEPLAQDVRAIRASAEYLQKLAGGLSMLATDPARGRAAEAVDVHAWWAEAEPMLRNALPRGVRLQGRFPDAQVRASIPRAALMQAVFNLVQNSGEALRGRADGLVTVWADPREDGVTIGVTDNGPGMPDEVRRRCMEPFFTTKTRGVSTGLGLALVYSLVRDAGGTVGIDSEPGRGTTFRLLLRAPDRGTEPDGERGRAARVAVVALRDKRLRAFAAAELEHLSFRVQKEGMSADADLVVVDETAGLRARPDARIVVVGDSPSPDEGGSRVVVRARATPSSLQRALQEAAREP